MPVHKRCKYCNNPPGANGRYCDAHYAARRARQAASFEHSERQRQQAYARNAQPQPANLEARIELLEQNVHALLDRIVQLENTNAS